MGPRVGVVGVPGAWSTETLADRLLALTGFRLVLDMAEVAVDLAAGRARWREVELTGLDGLIVKKIAPSYAPDGLDLIQMLRVVEDAGVRVQPSVASLERLFNRASGTLALRRAGVAMPATVLTASVEAAADAVERYGRAVLKPLYSTKARGMRLLAAGPRAELIDALTAFKAENPVLLVQQAVELPDRDLAVVLLDGAHLGTYARVRAERAWNTTTASGGHYAPHRPSQAVLALAAGAQAAFGLTFASVDVAETPAGPVVFEVSAFGGFRGLREACGIDAAEPYARHVVAGLARRRCAS